MEAAKSNRTLTPGGTKSLQHHAYHGRASRKGSPQETRQRSFLTTRFDDIPIFDVAPAMMNCLGLEDGEHLILGGYEIDLPKNLSTLRKSVEAYCKVHGGKVPAKNPHPIKELQALYQAVSKCCPEQNEIEINYFEETNELAFIELVYSPYPDYSVTFLPVKFVDTLPPSHRQFFLEFLSLMRVTMQIPFPEEHFDFAYATGYFDDEYLEEVMKEDQEYADMVTSYRDGDAKLLFDEIYNTPWQQLDSNGPELEQRLKSLADNAPSHELERLVEIASEGISLFFNENIRKYRFNKGYCSIPEFDDQECQDETCSYDRVVGFCYGDENEDPVTMRALDGLSNDAGNFCQEELYEPKLISPEYDKPAESSNLPQKWFEWFINFNERRLKYEQAIKNDVRNLQSQAGDCGVRMQ